MKCGILAVFTFVLCLCGSSVVSAAGDDGVSSAQSLAGFTNRYLTANGGVDKLKSLHSLRMTAVRTVRNGDSGKFVYLNRFPFFERSRWNGPKDYELRRGYNGRDYWLYSCTYDSRGELDMSSEPQMPLFDWTIFDPNACGASLELLPMETLGGRNCYRIQASFAGGRMRNFWFDADSFRLVKIVDVLVDGKNRFFVIDKSMKSDGVWFPQVMRELDADGVELERVDVRELETNIGLLPAFADPPNYPAYLDKKN